MKEGGKRESAAGQRLFFALWPASDLQQRIARQSASLEQRGRPLPAANLHLTLLFLGPTPPDARACLERAAAGLRLPAFDLCLDTLVLRRRQRMLWLQPSVTPEPLSALVAALREAAARCGLSIEAHPFVAHMTLWRKLALPGGMPAPDELQAPAFHWPVREFALVASKTLPQGAEYRVLKKWSLHRDGDESRADPGPHSME